MKTYLSVRTYLSLITVLSIPAYVGPDLLAQRITINGRNVVRRDVRVMVDYLVDS
jgi:hypothetical protein